MKNSNTRSEGCLCEHVDCDLTAVEYHKQALLYSQDYARLSEAVEYSRLAWEADNNNAWYNSFYGRDLIHTGKMDQGITYLRRAVDMAPQDRWIHSNYLWYLHYLPGQTRQDIYDEYCRWAQKYMPIHMANCSYDNDPDPYRRLRIGYISPDFYGHTNGFSFEPVLDGHDRSLVEVYGYSNVAHPDQVTERLQCKFDQWHPIRALDDARVAKLIAEDRIDILIEIGGHCTDNRLGVLAFKPAPVQVDYGGISTTGMQQIDYRVTDTMVDPPVSDQAYVEKLLYIPNGVYCYRPPAVSPLVAPLPALRHGFVTFGMFNNHVKITPRMISLWAQILHRIPDARLIMKSLAFSDPGIQEHYQILLERSGIQRYRVHMYGLLPHFQHLELLAQVDMALDTYPYNGCMTIQEALWMGVPTVTLAGDTHVSRMGMAILHQVGLDHFVATHPDEYVDKACAYASQRAALAQIRSSLRNHLLQSTLCDPKRLSHELENAYRSIWLQWCKSQGVVISESMQNPGTCKDTPAPVATCTQEVLPNRASREHQYLTLLQKQPCAKMYAELADICVKDIKRISEAVAYGRKAVELAPDCADYCSMLGMHLIRSGHMQEGIDYLRQAVRHDPDHSIHKLVLLWWLHYLPDVDSAHISEGYHQWAQRHAPISLARQHHTNHPDPERRLRIGFLSSDFHNHSVVHNFKVVVEHCRREVFALYGYGSVAQPDEVTAYFEKSFDGYRDIYRLSDREAADLITRDGIDILIEIGGHTTDSRLGIMSYKPAPVQVDYQGIDTTGMPQIDYRFTDVLLDPLEFTRSYRERSVYLCDGLICFTPPTYAPIVSLLPARRNGYVTFGSFNNNAKMSDLTIQLWADVLKACSQSRLVLKFLAGRDPQVRADYLHRFMCLGISPDRIDIYSSFPSPLDHLQLYGQVDLALDTYPFSGCITTLESLWMGVPVVSLYGDCYASRCGLAILERIGLPHFAAATPEAFVSTAVTVVGDVETLAQLRQSLRQRMRASPLCDTTRFVHQLEAAWRMMWRHWCGSRRSLDRVSCREDVSRMRIKKPCRV